MQVARGENMINERIALDASQRGDLDEELVRHAGHREPHAEGEGNGEHDAVQRTAAARPGRLYDTGMFGLLAAAQIAWFGAIGYVIFVLLQ
jgi:hypothetical protein